MPHLSGDIAFFCKELVILQQIVVDDAGALTAGAFRLFDESDALNGGATGQAHVIGHMGRYATVVRQRWLTIGQHSNASPQAVALMKEDKKLDTHDSFKNKNGALTMAI